MEGNWIITFLRCGLVVTSHRFKASVFEANLKAIKIYQQEGHADKLIN